MVAEQPGTIQKKFIGRFGAKGKGKGKEEQEKEKKKVRIRHPLTQP